MTAVRVILGILTSGLSEFYFWGVRDGGGDSPSTVVGPTASDPADCQAACKEWDHARQMLCAAKADEQAARDRANGIRGQLAAAIAAAATLTAAGIAIAVGAAASGTPWTAVVLAIIAAVAFAAALACWIAAEFLGGQLTSAEADVTAKAKVRADWDAAVVAARDAVNAKCSVAEANACLSRTAPCS
jgi:hypothetical protein